MRDSLFKLRNYVLAVGKTIVLMYIKLLLTLEYELL